MTDSKFLAVAKQAAAEAGEIVKKYYQSELELHNKGHVANFATKADLESESKIIKIIKKNFPTHNIIAEESGTIDNGSEYSWAIDPIDGTIPFVDGLPYFAVSVGLLKNNQPFIGVINMVVSGDLYWAEEGKGAFKNGKPINVSEESALDQSTIALEWGHTDRLMRIDKHLRPIVEKVRYAYMFGSSVYECVLVAQGTIEGTFVRANIWDLAAGAILIKEAGGELSDQQGKDVDYSSVKVHLLASNGKIHTEFVSCYN